MLFNSHPFIFVFLPTILAFFFTFCYLKMPKMAQLTLLLASLFFYGYWDIRFLPLLTGSILFNYVSGNVIYKADESKKLFFTLASIGVNLALLFYCKYWNFFIEITQTAFSLDYSFIELILPLGISFFTFTQIAYLADVYQKRSVPCDFIAYGLFVTIFPHLIAGPILHHKEMVHQFNDSKMFRWSTPNFSQGCFLFVLGLSKKVLIADNLISIVKPIFDGPETTIPFIQAWAGAIAYTLQLYFDFSGYSDMAVGLGLLFNLHLPINFNSPYQASSVIDFWRRWHVSLSNFLRDYLYIPLGGNRKGESSKMRNLFLTMLLGGLWHGAGWTYVVWGALHGSFLIVNHLWRKLNIRMYQWTAQLLTMTSVIVAWVIFRSPSMTKASHILKGMLGFNGIVLPEKYAHKYHFLHRIGISFADLEFSHFKSLHIAVLAVLFALVLKGRNTNDWKDRFQEKPVFWGTACGLLFFMCVLKLDSFTEFLYYQF